MLKPEAKLQTSPSYKALPWTPVPFSSCRVRGKCVVLETQYVSVSKTFSWNFCFLKKFFSKKKRKKKRKKEWICSNLILSQIKKNIYIHTRTHVYISVNYKLQFSQPYCCGNLFFSEPLVPPWSDSLLFLLESFCFIQQCFLFT